MSTRGFFITGTDTGIGKTWSTLALMQACKIGGMKVAGMKPVASGSEETGGELRNEDALMIQSYCSRPYPYELINPYVFREPIAPHIAAAKNGITISIGKIVDAYRLLSEKSDVVMVEGIGGWRVPITEDHTTSEMVEALDLPVILVVGLRLGCINHALLTNQVIQSDNIKLAGWIVSCVDKEYLETEKTIQTLIEKIDAPLLGKLPFSPVCDVEALGKHISINDLLENWPINIQ